MQTKKRGWLWPAAAITAATLMWAVSALANWWAGTNIPPPGSDPWTPYIMGGASVSADILKTVMLFALTYAIARRQWVVTAVAGVIFGLCVVWSMQSATRFVASLVQERVATADHQRQVADAQRQLADVQTKRLAFLAEQTVQLPGSGRPLREALIEERERHRAEFERVSAEVEASLAALRAQKPIGKDPIAATFHVDENWLYVATVLAFALLVEVVSGAALWVVASVRSTPEPDLGYAIAQSGGVEVRAPHQPSTPPSAPEPPRGPAGPAGPPSARHENVVHIPRNAALRDTVKAAVEARLVFERDGRAKASDVYQSVRGAIPEHVVRATSHDSKLLARLIQEAVETRGARKRKIAGYVHFVGCRVQAESHLLTA